MVQGLLSGKVRPRSFAEVSLANHPRRAARLAPKLRDGGLLRVDFHSILPVDHLQSTGPTRVRSVHGCHPGGRAAVVDMDTVEPGPVGQKAIHIGCLNVGGAVPRQDFRISGCW